MVDCIVIGAGPSGMMAALMASQYGKTVMLVDKNKQIGKKMRLSGGGRCNITNYKETKAFIDHLPIKNGRFLYSALTNFGPYAIYQFFEQLGVPLKIEKGDKVFPQSDRSSDFVDVLEEQLKNNGVIFQLETTVEDIQMEENTKIVQTNKGSFTTKNIVIATGGLSYPHTGSTGFGHEWARKNNLSVTRLFPTESPLISNDSFIQSKQLQGLSFQDITLTLVDEQNRPIQSHHHDLIITHFGLSGPAALMLSQFVGHYLDTHQEAKVLIDTCPTLSIETLEQQLLTEKERNGSKKVKSILHNYGTKRFIDYIMDTQSINPDGQMAHLTRSQINDFIQYLKAFPITIHGVKELKFAFVTGGGIDLKSINPKSMEHKEITGLYFTGEVLDLHGYTGGYNITIALSTGYTAGLAIGRNY